MRNSFSIFAAALLCFGTAGIFTGGEAAAAPRKMENTSIVVMRTIDKLSARTHTFEIPVDKTVKFGNSLFIKVRSCKRASPLDRPESAAFMQIWERKPSEKDSTWIFSGWMFASNPSLSAMDHPVYDVWVMECKNAATAAKPAEVFSSEKAPEHAPETDGKPAASPEDEPVVDTEAADTEAAPEPGDTATPAKPGKPVPAAAATPVAPAGAPVAGEKPPLLKPAPMPPVDQLPGSFEDGGDSEASPGPNAGPANPED